MSSSVTSTSSSSASNMIRFSGMASGLDTDSIVKQLMNAEKLPYTKLQQQRQTLQWTQDAYREQTTYIKGFQSTYFDTLSANNMRKATMYQQYSSALTSTVAADSTAITVTAGSTATAGNHNIVVNQLAKGANIATDGILSTNAISTTAGICTIDASNNTLNLALGIDASKPVEIASGTYDLATSTGKADFLTKLQSGIDTAFGTGKIAASLTSDNKIVLKSSGGKDIKATTANNDLGIVAGKTVKTTSLSTKLSDIASGKVTLKIGTTDVIGGTAGDAWDLSGANANATVNDLINAVKNSSVGATLSYDTVNNKFTLASNTTGTSSALGASSTSSDVGKDLLTGFGFGTEVSGTNAQYTVDGATMIGASNTNTIDGVSYTFNNKTATTGVNVSITKNTDAVIQKVKDFVAKYNEAITKLTEKVTEKHDRNYTPLTDDQKDAMKDDDITKWETKAKAGLLHNDSTLKDQITQMRNAISEPVEINGVKYTLSSFGVQTVSYLEDPTGSMTGILKVDETKLKAGLEGNLDAVVKVFSNESSTAYNPTDTSDSASTNRQTRYKENGIMNRLNDIMNDAARTYPGKGSLLEKAGYTNDRTEYDNTIYNQLKEMDDKLYDMNEKLTAKENAYYTKFSNLETLMSKMNSQSSSLASQLAKL